MNTNITDYVAAEQKKVLISQIIKSTFNSIEDYEEATELVYSKLKSIDKLRDLLKQNSLEHIKESLKTENNTKVAPEQVIDAWVYFALVVENVWLSSELNKSRRGQ